MSVLKVKTFNKMAEKNFKEAMEGYHKGERQQPPFKPMYLFYLLDNVTLRKKGYVITEGNSHRFFATKEEVFQQGYRIAI